jgi:hypothetical protein
MADSAVKRQKKVGYVYVLLFHFMVWLCVHMLSFVRARMVCKPR